MSVTQRVIRIVFGLVAVVGLILLIGTAGADDHGMISFNQSMKQAFIGLLLLVVGIAGSGGGHED